MCNIVRIFIYGCSEKLQALQVQVLSTSVEWGEGGGVLLGYECVELSSCRGCICRKRNEQKRIKKVGKKIIIGAYIQPCCCIY